MPSSHAHLLPRERDRLGEVGRAGQGGRWDNGLRLDELEVSLDLARVEVREGLTVLVENREEGKEAEEDHHLYNTGRTRGTKRWIRVFPFVCRSLIQISQNSHLEGRGRVGLLHHLLPLGRDGRDDARVFNGQGGVVDLLVGCDLKL